MDKLALFTSQVLLVRCTWLMPGLPQEHVNVKLAGWKLGMAGLLGKTRALLPKLPETCSEMPEAQPVANKLCSRIVFVILRNDILAPEPSPPGNLTPSCVIIANICHAQT